MERPSDDEIKRRIDAISRLRDEHVEEMAHNRGFLAGLAAASVAGLVMALKQAPEEPIRHNLLRTAVVVAAIAVACSLILLLRRERLIWGVRWTEDARLHQDMTGHPEIQRFWQEDMGNTRAKTPSSSEIRTWTFLTMVLLASAGALTAAAYW